MGQGRINSSMRMAQCDVCSIVQRGNAFLRSCHKATMSLEDGLRLGSGEVLNHVVQNTQLLKHFPEMISCVVAKYIGNSPRGGCLKQSTHPPGKSHRTAKLETGQRKKVKIQLSWAPQQLQALTAGNPHSSQ